MNNYGDMNLRTFSAGFQDVASDNRFLWVGESTDADNRSHTRGNLPRAYVQRAKMFPLRADGHWGWSSPWVGLATGAHGPLVSSALMAPVCSANGWTTNTATTITSRAVGDTWTLSGATNCPTHAIEFYKSGSFSDARSLNVAEDGGASGIPLYVMPCVHGSHLHQSSGVDVFGGDPFFKNHTLARLVTLQNAAGPTDMILRALRVAQADTMTAWSSAASAARINTMSTNVSAFPGSNKQTLNLSTDPGTVKGWDVDCLDGIGTGTGFGYADTSHGMGVPGLALCNPTAYAVDIATERLTELKFGVLGYRFCRHSAGVPLAGTAMAVMATSSKTITDFTAQLGGGTPVFSAANAASWVLQQCGRGAGYQMPTHVYVKIGHNIASNESAELAAGTTTQAVANLVEFYNTLAAMATTNGSAMPKVCIIFAEAHQSSKTVTTTLTLEKACQIACAQTGMAMVNLFRRTNRMSLATGAATPWATPAMFPYAQGANITSKASSGAGPVINTEGTDSLPDGLHNSNQGAQYLAGLIDDAMIQSQNFIPTAYFLGVGGRPRYMRSRRLYARTLTGRRK